MKAIFIFLLSTISLLSAITVQELFPKLEYGEYAVGYRIYELYDHGRTYGFPDENSPDKTLDRPVQISLWYPALQNDLPGICYLEYEYSAVTEVNFEADLQKKIDEFKEEKIGFFRKYEADLSLLEEVFSMEMKAQRDAEFIHEGFPLVIYNPGGNEKSYENCVLFEFLASHGYVIVSTPSFGTDSRDIIFNNALLQSLLADMRFNLAFVKELGISNDHLAAMGFCLGGFICDLFARENINVQALIEIYGEIGNSESREILACGPYETPKNQELAYLQLDVTDKSIRDDFLFENLKYSDAWQFRYEDVKFTAFTSFYLMQCYPVQSQIGDYQLRKQVYQSICENVLYFLNFYLKQDEKALQKLRTQLEVANAISGSVSFREGKIAPPSSTEFIELLKKDFNQAYDTYLETKKEDPKVSLFSENVLNMLGYKYLQDGETEIAVRIFEMNKSEFPDSWNVYDSLGDGYFARQEYMKSKENYQRSLELNPNNIHALEKIAEIEGMK